MGPQPGLLERERELATIDALVDDVREGAARVVVVEGRAGIGKSRVLAAARDHAAERGLRTLSARGTELEQQFAYGAVRQLFEPLRADPEQWEAALAGAAEPARAVFETASLISADDGEAVRDASYATLHGLYWLTLNLSAHGPLMLAIDDVHWCDRSSLRFLAYMAPRVEGLPLFVALGLRTGEPGTDPALLADIVSDPGVRTVRPGPLSAGAVHEMVAARLGEDADERFSAACLEATGGNPLLLGQLISSLESERVAPRASEADTVRAIGPRAVSRTILLRLSRLPGPAAQVAGAIAVLGESATLPLVGALCDIDERTAADAIAALARVDIIAREAPLEFVHPLVREAIYRELPPGQRELDHDRAARVLRDAGASAGAIATQLLNTPGGRGDAEVTQMLRDAASDAIRRGATEAAVGYLKRALVEPPPAGERPDVLYELGVVEADSVGPQALEHLRAAYDELTDVRKRAWAAFWITRLAMHTGPGLAVEAAEFARGASRALPPELVNERYTFDAFAVTAIYWGGTEEPAQEVFDLHRSGPVDHGPGARMAAGSFAFDWALRNGPADRCVATAEKTIRGELDLNLLSGTADIMAAIVLEYAERDVWPLWDGALEEAHRGGSLFWALGLHLWRGWNLVRQGSLTEGEESLREALAEEALWGVPPIQTYAPSFLAWTLIEQGKLADAHAVLDPLPIESIGTYGGQQLHRARAELFLAEGSFDAALAEAETGEAMLPWIVNPASVPWGSLQALALDGLGRTEEAIARASAELERAREWGASGPIGRTTRVLGTLRREEGLDDLREAVALLEHSPLRLERAKALAALGSAQRRARQPAEARVPLRGALELAEACGAQSLVEHVRAELAAAGAKPRSSALSGVEALTPSEKRIVALAAEGQTNRDIAQALYVTPKTVEVHLSNSYRKLGIRSRRELAGALGSAA
jgi:DNA-binding CsgD family transcriptional regulator